VARTGRGAVASIAGIQNVAMVHGSGGRLGAARHRALVWHVPALYDAAVEHESIHALQHAMFVGTSALFWWGLIYGRYGRVGYGAAVFYVFTTVVHTGILGAAMTFSGIPLYPVYAAPAAARGIDVLEDQQLAGLIMWIPAGIVLTLFGLALFAAWLGEAERRSRFAPGGTTDAVGTFRVRAGGP
jgi:cytochrome c oxidase assembly factor CtaG